METNDLLRKRYLEYYQIVKDTITHGKDVIDSRIFALATGGLVLSFTVFSFMFTQHYDLNVWLVCLIWAVYGLCILLNLLSHLISVRNNTKMLDKIVTLMKDANVKSFDESDINKEARKKSKFIVFINCFEFIALVLNIIFSISFTLYYLI